MKRFDWDEYERLERQANRLWRLIFWLIALDVIILITLISIL